MHQPQPEAVKTKINVESELLKLGMKHSPPPPPCYNPVSFAMQEAANVDLVNSTSPVLTDTQPETPPPSFKPPPPPVPSRPPVQRQPRVQFITPVDDASVPIEHVHHVRSELTIDIGPPDYYIVPTSHYAPSEGLLLAEATKSVENRCFSADSVKTLKESAQESSSSTESDGTEVTDSDTSAESETSDDERKTGKVDDIKQKEPVPVSVPYKLLKSEKEEINVKDKTSMSKLYKSRIPLEKEISTKDKVSLIETYQESKADKQESNIKESMIDTFQESIMKKKETNIKDKITVSEVYKESSKFDKKRFDIQDKMLLSESYKRSEAGKDVKDKISSSEAFEERIVDKEKISGKNELSTSELHKGSSAYMSSLKDVVSTSETTSKVIKESVTISEKMSVINEKELQIDEKLKDVMEMKNILSKTKPPFPTRRSDIKSTSYGETSQVFLQKETLPVCDTKENLITPGSSIHVHEEKESFTSYGQTEKASTGHDMKKVTIEKQSILSSSHDDTQTNSSAIKNLHRKEAHLSEHFKSDQHVASTKLSNLPKPQKPLLKQSLGLSKSVETLDTTGYSTLPTSPSAKQWSQPGQDSATVPRSSKMVRFDNGSATHSRHSQHPQAASPPSRDLHHNFYQSMPSLNSPTEHEVLRASISEIPHPAHVEYTMIQSPPATATYQTSLAPSPLHPDYAYYGIPRFSGHFQYPATNIPPVIHGQIPGKQVMPAGIAYIPVPVSSYGTPIPTFYPHSSTLPPHVSTPNANLPTYHLVPYPQTPTNPHQYPIMSVPLAQLMDSGAAGISEPKHPHDQTSEYHTNTENIHSSQATNFKKDREHEPTAIPHFFKSVNQDLRYKANSVTDLYKPLLPLKPALKKEISKSQNEISSLGTDSKSGSPPPPPINYSTLPKSPISPSWEELFRLTPALREGERQSGTKFASMTESARLPSAHQHVKVGYLTVTHVQNSFMLC